MPDACFGLGDDAAALGPHQAEGEGDDPNRQKQIDQASGQAERISVMLGVEEGDQSDKGFGRNQQLGQAFAAALLGGVAEDPHSAKPGRSQDKEYDRHDQITDTIRTIMPAGRHYRIQAVGNSQKTQKNELDKRRDGRLVGKLHVDSL